MSSLTRRIITICSLLQLKVEINSQKNRRICFATFSDFILILFLTFLAPRTAVTNVIAVRALQTIACEQQAALFLVIKHLLHELAFVLCRRRNVRSLSKTFLS
jgi:hypothetical protein